MAVYQSCDTFVVLQSCTGGKYIIFGKNSDRPASEVQEIVYVPSQQHSSGAKLKCTYIEIDQVAGTNAVILSKPAWMWGAEMGANEHGVVIGNEAVWTRCGEDSEEKLLGMDLVRLGLERASTAENCVDVIVSLLEKYGQGGSCSEDSPGMLYNNSFLIVDRTEAWVLETAGSQWAAEKITSGFRNISNVLTIRTKIDKMSRDLKSEAKSKSWWTGEQPFDFAVTYSDDIECSRFENGRTLLSEKTRENKFAIGDMMNILRDKSSGICMSRGGTGSATTSSQVSVLAPNNKNLKAVHFFTGTPDPSQSTFKPFVFPKVTHSLDHKLSSAVKSPEFGDTEDPAKQKPRFARKVDRRHALYKCHEAALDGQHPKQKTAHQIRHDVLQMENMCVTDVQTSLDNDELISDPETLFNEAVEAELKIYKY